MFRVMTFRYGNTDNRCQFSEANLMAWLELDKSKREKHYTIYQQIVPELQHKNDCFSGWSIGWLVLMHQTIILRSNVKPLLICSDFFFNVKGLHITFILVKHDPAINEVTSWSEMWLNISTLLVLQALAYGTWVVFCVFICINVWAVTFMQPAGIKQLSNGHA